MLFKTTLLALIVAIASVQASTTSDAGDASKLVIIENPRAVQVNPPYGYEYPTNYYPQYRTHYKRADTEAAEVGDSKVADPEAEEGNDKWYGYRYHPYMYSPYMYGRY